MQLRTLLALICTLAVVSIEQCSGDAAAVKPAAVVNTASASPLKPVKKVAGARTAWSTKINKKSKKLFDSHAKIVSKKLHEVHKVDLKFKPKPSKTATQIVSGILHHYLVELPTKKYAHVTILHQAWKKGGSLNEKHVTVRPDLYELNDPNV